MRKRSFIETPRSVDIATIILTASLASRRDTIVIRRVVLSVRYVPAATFRKRSRTSGDDDSEFFIPVIAHNMKGFDAHLILKTYERNVAKRGSQINVIPSNTEKFTVMPWPIIAINTKNCSLSIVLTATDQKPQKSLKR